MPIKRPNFRKALDELNKEIKKEIPSYELLVKERSTLMKIISTILFFNKDFMKGYTTTIGSKVYRPFALMSDKQATFETVSHEWVHLTRFKKYNNILMAIYYLLPQALAALSILSILQIWLGGLWILNLFWLLLLLPLPSPSRTKEELEAYTMSMFVLYHIYGRISKKNIDFIASNFYGPSYYWMWPMKEDIIKRLEKRARLIESGHYDDVYPFKNVKKIMENNPQ